MKQRPRLTSANNPLQRRPAAGEEPALPTEPLHCAIPDDLRPQLQALQRQWHLSETELVTLALRVFLAQMQRRPVAPHPPLDNDQLMDFLD